MAAVVQLYSRSSTRTGDLDPTSAGTAGDAALWGGSSAVVGMAATPLGAHQAGGHIAGRKGWRGVPGRDSARGSVRHARIVPRHVLVDAVADNRNQPAQLLDALPALR